MSPEQPAFRTAVPADAPAVAALHTDSWRRHYRGTYSDDYLDGDLAEDRLRVWTGRMTGDEPHGARDVGSRPSTPPGGVPGRLHGSPVALRYAWPDPRTLLAG